MNAPRFLHPFRLTQKTLFMPRSLWETAPLLAGLQSI
jgi:hypothetical protein